MKNVFLYAIALLQIVLMAACSDNDYLNAIPSKSTALISVDMQTTDGDGKGVDKENILKSMLHVENVSDCGIDVTEKLYLLKLLMATWDSVPRLPMRTISVIGSINYPKSIFAQN